MYTFQVPPFIEVKVATTDEDIRRLRRQHVVVKPPLCGTSRSNLDDVVQQWIQEVILAGMRDPSLELSRTDDLRPLSILAITRAAESIIERFDGIINPEDVFYLVYPQTISRLASGIRNTLQVAGWPETKEWEINGVRYQQKKPYTYWLSTPGFSTYGQVKMALYESSLFHDESRVPGSGVRVRRCSQKLTTASSLWNHNNPTKENDGGQTQHGSFGIITQAWYGRRRGLSAGSPAGPGGRHHGR